MAETADEEEVEKQRTRGGVPRSVSHPLAIRPPKSLKRPEDAKSIKEVSAEGDEDIDDGISNVARIQSPSSQTNKLGAVKKFKEYGKK